MSIFEVTFLGTTAGIPTIKRAHPALHIRYQDGGEYCFLFDCGEGVQRQFLFADINPMKIEHIFISHWHGDHFLGLMGLIDTMNFEKRKTPVYIYTPEIEKLKKFLNLGHNLKEFDVNVIEVSKSPVIESVVFETPDLFVSTVPVEHGIPAVAFKVCEKERERFDREKANSFGLPKQGLIYKEIKEKKFALYEGRKILFDDIYYKINGKSIVYSGDTEVCESLMKLADGCDLLIHDCTYFDCDELDRYRHACLEDILKMLEKITVKKLVLTHISRRYDNIRELKSRIENYPNIIIAEDFMKLQVE